VDTHVLQAIGPNGGPVLEIGRLGSLELCVRLRNALALELGDEYSGFIIVELDPEAECLRALERACGGEIVHVTRARSFA
jgi:hypothetical protein